MNSFRTGPISVVMLSVLCLFALIGASKGLSQVQEWVQTYSGSGGEEDAATGVAFDVAGNVYVTGRSDGGGSGLDYATIKYSPAGVQEWVQRYNGPGNGEDAAAAIAVDASGNVYVTGYSEGSGTGSDYATVKYSSSGVQLWVARYNGASTFPDEALAIRLDDAGNVYVTGRSSNRGAFYDWDYATVKYDASGVQQWAARYNGPASEWDQANAIAVDADGNVYVTGTHEFAAGTAYHDCVTIKYNSSGVQQWIVIQDGLGHNWDEGTAIEVDDEGNVYMAGFISGNGTVYDFLTIKYSSAGVQQWIRVYDGPTSFSPDVARAMVVGDGGDVYVTGASGLNFGTIKYNALGVQQWVATYDANGNFDAANDISVDGSGNVFVTGVSQMGIRESTSDCATVKYNASGVEQWVQRFNGAANGWDEGNSIAVDAMGNVYVAGSTTAGGAFDYGTIRYSPEGIECSEISQFLARCIDGSMIQARVTLLNSTGHAGETVTLMVDGDTYPATIGTNGTHSRAQILASGYSAGDHSVQLVVPAGCFDPINVTCQAGGTLADVLWEQDDARWEGSTSGIHQPVLEGSVELRGNYPNPFNPTTAISYQLSADSWVFLRVYNVLGEEVATLINEHQIAGSISVTWDGKNSDGVPVPSGVYIYRLTAGNVALINKMMFLK